MRLGGQMYTTLRALKHQRPVFGRQFIGNTEDWVAREANAIGSWAKRREAPSISIVSPSSPVFSAPNCRFIGSPQIPSLDDPMTPSRWWLLPSAFVLMHFGGYLDSSSGHVRTRRNDLLDEVAHHWNRSKPQRPNSLKSALREIIEVPGISTVLSAPGYDSYYHWLMQVLPRIALLKPYIHQIDTFFVADDISSVLFESLVWLGIPATKIRNIKLEQRYLCTHMLVTSLPGAEGAVSSSTLNFLREHGHEASEDHERGPMYLIRGGRRRRLLNEDAVIDLMVKRGVRVIDCSSMSVSEQAKTLSKASAIISAHGAALTNMVFAKQASVLEIFSPRTLVPDCYPHLAFRSGHQYNWSVSGGTGPDRDGNTLVDINHLNAVLEKFLELQGAELEC